MINIIHFGIALALATLFLSCGVNPMSEQKISLPPSEASAQQDKHVGRWEATVGDLTISLVLRENHECVFSIPDGTANGTWSASGQKLTVDIPDTPSMGGETFHGLLNAEGDELEFWEEGSERVILE